MSKITKVINDALEHWRKSWLQVGEYENPERPPEFGELLISYLENANLAIVKKDEWDEIRSLETAAVQEARSRLLGVEDEMLRMRQQLSTANAFRTMALDLDRNEHGRHVGDSDMADPEGVSKGNPFNPTGSPLGYSLGGDYVYVIPERENMPNPEAWKMRKREWNEKQANSR